MPTFHDGKHWVLWIQQGKREKSVYFNNDFPRSITKFAEQVDDILLKASLNNAAWQPVSDSDTRKHERELWDSLNAVETHKPFWVTWYSQSRRSS